MQDYLKGVEEEIAAKSAEEQAMIDQAAVDPEAAAAMAAQQGGAQQAAMDPEAAAMAEQAAMAQQAGMDPEAAAMAEQQAAAQQQPPQPNAVEAATNGKFKSIEEIDQLLAQVDEYNQKQSMFKEAEQIHGLYKMYGADAFHIASLANVDVDALPIQDLLYQAFVKNNPDMTAQAQREGFLIELKQQLGDPNLVLDLDDEEGLGHEPESYYGQKIQSIAGSKRAELSEYFKSLAPSLLEASGEADPGGIQSYALSDDEKTNLAQAAKSFDRFGVRLGDGENAELVEILVNEVPGFAQIAEQIAQDPKKYLESKYLVAGSDNKTRFNMDAALRLELLEHALPLLLQKHAGKVGESRYTDGLAEGSGKSLDDLKAALGISGKRSDAANRQLTPEEQRQAEIDAGKNNFYSALKRG